MTIEEIAAKLSALEKNLESINPRVAELEKAVKTLLKTVQHYEKKYSKDFMPAGEFCGVKF